MTRQSPIFLLPQPSNAVGGSEVQGGCGEQVAGAQERATDETVVQEPSTVVGARASYSLFGNPGFWATFLSEEVRR